MTTLAETLGAYAADLSYEDLPPAVIHQAKRMIVDTLGCALGGYDSEPARIALEQAATITSTRPATILCTGRQTSPDLAAFANGVMIRYLDYNDGYIGREAGHPSDSIAALLTAAEIGRANGRELIVATVIAYEMFCRMCDIVNFKPMGFDHTTIGAMASVLGAARLMGLNREQIATALSITVAANVALYQTRIGNVSMWKGCAYANASRNAIFFAEMAQRGMTGPSPVFEGRGGYFVAVTRKPFELAPFGGKDQPEFRIMDCLIKRYPLGQYSQSVAHAALEARARVLIKSNTDVGDIAEIHVRTLHTAIEMMAGDPDKWTPANRETADHSMPYTAGVALMYGVIDIKYFDDPYLHDPALLALIAKIKCTVSEEANSREPEAMLCDMDLVLKDGKREAIRVEYHRGHPKNPMSDDEIEEKFRSLAGERMPKPQLDALLKQLWHLEQLTEMQALFKLTQIS
ncbi:MAG: MmgE/PrpD family protein [Burkholderiales bacterium]|nr:MmgE/PrpD family protein [Burkholderiales bacterium]